MAENINTTEQDEQGKTQGERGMVITGMNDATPTTQNEATPQGDLLAMAINRGVDTDKLQALIDMKNAEEARRAKQEFDRRFAEMQAEFEPARRTKQGHDYMYAPVEELQRQYGPIIAKHGFSYRWKETDLDNDKKRVTLQISGYGHTEENSFDVPAIEGTKMMNAIQREGARSTYGRRYTFISGFGVVVDDLDNDVESLTFEQGAKYAQYIDALSQETDVQSGSDKAKKFYYELRDKGDQEGATVIKQFWTKRKAELQKEAE